MNLSYEDIEVGDIVCAKTEFDDIDTTTLGKVTKKLEKSSYELMRVIKVDYFYTEKQNRHDYPGCYSPKELIKIDVKSLYHIMRCQMSWQKFLSIKVKR